MKKWEHEMDQGVREGRETFHLKGTLKSRSEQGWELVSVAPRITNSTGDNFHLFWKRPIKGS